MATIYGTTLNDSLTTGTAADDSFYTGAGGDYVQASGGNDLYSLGYRNTASYFRYGFNDYDSVDYRYAWSSMGLTDATSAYIVADMQAGTITKFNGASVLGIDTVIGGDGVLGTQASDSFLGRDYWMYEEFRGYGGNDTINGRGGEDAASYSNATTAGITVNMAAGTVTSTDAEVGTDTLREVEDVVGTNFADTYVATGYSGTSTNRNSFGLEWNIFNPLAGDDVITGNGQTGVNLGGVGGRITVNLSGQANVSSTINLVSSFTPEGAGYTPGAITASGVYFVIAGNYNDSLTGGGRVNTIGALAQNTLAGDQSFEYFRGQGGNDTIRGGTGFDRADFRQSAPMTEGIEVDLAAGRVTGDPLVTGTDTLRGIESIRGTYLDDLYDARGFTLSNAVGASVNNGDILATPLAGSTLPSQAFNEFLASAGNDTVLGNGATRVTLDYVVEKQAGVSARVLFTSAQAGSVDYGLTDGGLGRVTFDGTFSVRGSLGHDDMTGAAGFQNLQGGYGNDTLRGGDGADSLYGYQGGDKAALNLSTNFTDNDWLDGGTGNDLLRGDFGNDDLEGGVGIDTMEGGTGNDTYHVDHAGDVVTELAAAGTDTVYSKLANHTLALNVENGRIAVATAANLTGNTLNNLLVGSTGNNVLTGAVGRDTLTGGGGNDTFDYNASSESGVTATTWDVVTDFTAGDRIDLAGIDADTDTVGDDAFSATFVTAFTAAGQLRFDAATGVLYGNTDGDVAAEFAIKLTGVAALAAADLVL